MNRFQLWFEEKTGFVIEEVAGIFVIFFTVWLIMFL